MSQISQDNQPSAILFLFINDNILSITHPFSSFLQILRKSNEAKEMALLTIKTHEHYEVIK